ncbi:MAG: hypothetical protein PHE89_06065 [Alphaproteobacteria bacterium]|nr:hypothetical protein [Alphaproteobacteria bacterium]
MEELKTKSFETTMGATTRDDVMNAASRYESENNGRRLADYIRDNINEENRDQAVKDFAYFDKIKEATKADEDYDDTHFRVKTKDDKLVMAVEMFKPSSFSFEISNGKVVIPDNASPEQAMQMLNYLSSKGISVDLSADRLNALLTPDATQGEHFSDVAEKKEKSSEEMIKDTDKKLVAMGKKKGLTSFKEGSFLSGWTTYTLFSSSNPDNMDKLVSVDKEGNIKYNFEIILKKRIKNGQKQVSFELPPGGKMTPEMVELILEGIDGDKVEFSGLRDSTKKDFRIACAKLGKVPVGLGMNLNQINEMVEEYGKAKGDGPEKIEYEMKLLEQLKKNRAKDGGLSEAEGKIYDAAREKVALKEFKGLFDKALNPRLAEFSRNGADATDVMASRYAAADVYTAYANVALRGGNISAIREEIKAVNERLGVKDANANDQYIKFIKAANVSPNASVQDLGPEGIAALYDALLPSRKEYSTNKLVDLYAMNEGSKHSEDEDRLSDRAIKKPNDYFSENLEGEYKKIMDKSHVLSPASSRFTYTINDEVKRRGREKARNNPSNSNSNSGRGNPQRDGGR